MDRAKPYDDSLNRQVESVLNSTPAYYDMLQDWHRLNEGLAVEPEVKDLIARECLPGALILEAGSGTGEIIHWFANRYRQTSFVGLDISRIAVERSLASKPGNATFQVADVKHVPYPASTFDFVFSQSSLEHVVGWQAAIAEFHRVLRQYGHLLIRVGNSAVREASSSWRALLRYVTFTNRASSVRPSFSLRPGNWSDHRSHFDVQSIPSDVLKSTLRSNGFKITYFSTGMEQLRHSANLKARLASYLHFWPFSHLGATTIIVGEKL